MDASAILQCVVLTPFHVAVQVRDIAEARRFYTEVLGCAEGRSASDWVDFNMFGHQFVCHLNPDLGRNGRVTSHRATRLTVRVCRYRIAAWCSNPGNGASSRRDSDSTRSIGSSSPAPGS